MKKLQKIFTLFVALVFLFTTSGLVSISHTCLSKVLAENSCSSCTSTENNCCSQEESSSSKCCSTLFSYNKLSIDGFTEKSIKINKNTHTEILIPFISFINNRIYYNETNNSFSINKLQQLQLHQQLQLKPTDLQIFRC